MSSVAVADVLAHRVVFGYSLVGAHANLLNMDAAADGSRRVEP